MINCIAAVNHTRLTWLWELLPKYSPVMITVVFICSSSSSLIAGLQGLTMRPSLLWNTVAWTCTNWWNRQLKSEQSAGNHFRGWGLTAWRAQAAASRQIHEIGLSEGGVCCWSLSNLTQINRRMQIWAQTRGSPWLDSSRVSPWNLPRALGHSAVQLAS